MTRKTILTEARSLWEQKKETVKNTAYWNICLDQINYLERNVKTKGLQLALYKSQALFSNILMLF